MLKPGHGVLIAIVAAAAGYYFGKKKG